MSKKKLTVIVLILLIIAAVFYKPVMQRLAFINSNTPKDKIKVEFINNSAKINSEFNLYDNCNEIGLYSKSDTFKGLLGENTNLQGNYTLTYLSKNGEVLKQKSEKFQDGAKPMGFVIVGSSAKHSTLMLDVVEIPFDIKQKNIIIDIKLDNLDSKILSSKNDIYLYVKKWKNLCGKEKTETEDRKIESPENNQTLKPLYEAIKNHDIDSVKKFFKDTKLPFSVKMRGDKTPLHYAVYFDDAEIISYLLTKDSSKIDQLDIAKKSALYYAVFYGYIDAVKEILKFKPDLSTIERVNNKQFLFFLLREVESCKNIKGNIIPGCNPYPVLEMLDILLDYGYDVNTPIKDGTIDKSSNTTILSNAIIYQSSYNNDIKYYGKSNSKNYTEFIEILKKHGAKTYEELYGPRPQQNKTVSYESYYPSNMKTKGE